MLKTSTSLLVGALVVILFISLGAARKESLPAFFSIYGCAQITQRKPRTSVFMSAENEVSQLFFRMSQRVHSSHSPLTLGDSQGHP